MATIETVMTKIRNLISKSNSTTGRNDSELTSAVNALVEGYGKGGGIVPSGSIDITENGTYDVTEKATAVVAVSTSEPICVVRTVELTADVTGTKNTVTLLSSDAFVKKHYSKEGFSAVLFRITTAASEAGAVHFQYHGNRNIGSSNVARYGIGYRSSSESAITNPIATAAINGSGYVQSLRADSSGNLKQYLDTGYILKAGTYQIILTCTT